MGKTKKKNCACAVTIAHVFVNKKHFKKIMDILSNREQYELDVCQANIDLFNKYINDYESLRCRLTTLADKTRHDILVPIAGTKYAFMPGQIYHSNEILVLLGDDYFVEKSTKETIEFINRRIKFCQEQLSNLEKQKTMQENWLNAANTIKEENEQFVDISEKCTEDEFQEWLKERNAKLKKSNEVKSTKPSEKMDLDKFFAKYEKEEQKNNELKSTRNTETMEINIIEKTNTEQPSKDTAINTTNKSQRPISKFKASRK